MAGGGIISWEGVNDWLEALGETVRNGVGIYDDVVGTIGGGNESSSTPTLGTNQTTDSNLGLSSFAFTPNMYLIGAGLFLLLLVFLAKK